MNQKRRKKLMWAVKQLREVLDLSQTQLAEKLGRGMSTVQRWENIAPARGQALAQLHQLATQEGQTELAAIFKTALREDLGQEVNKAFEPETITSEDPLDAVPKEAVDLFKKVYLLGKAGIPKFKEALERWGEDTYGLEKEEAEDVQPLQKAARQIQDQIMKEEAQIRDQMVEIVKEESKEEK